MATQMPHSSSRMTEATSRHLHQPRSHSSLDRAGLRSDQA